MSSGAMPASMAAGRLTIDLRALTANWQDLAARAGEAATAAIVKGDAYGIGIAPAAQALAEAGCHTFFVGLPEEGLRVREAVSDAAIYVLGGLIPNAATIATADAMPATPSAYRTAGTALIASWSTFCGWTLIGRFPSRRR